MSAVEDRRAALAKEVRGELSSFLLFDNRALFEERNKVLEMVAPAKSFGGRANELIERLENADRPAKFQKAFRVFRDHLKTMAIDSSPRQAQARPQKKSPRLPPHQVQSLAT